MIALTDRAGGTPLYFTLNSVELRGGDDAWVGDKSKALCFARDRDAKEFIGRYLRHYMHLIDLEVIHDN